MRVGSAMPFLGAGRLENDNWLAAPQSLRLLEKCLRIGELLKIKSDHLGLSVALSKIQEIDFINVGLISNVDADRHGQSLRVRAHHLENEASGKDPGLGKQRYTT